MTSEIIIYSSFLTFFGGYALLALYLLFHGTYTYCREARRERETRASADDLGHGEKRSEKDVFVYRREQGHRRSIWSSSHMDIRAQVYER